MAYRTESGFSRSMGTRLVQPTTSALLARTKKISASALLLRENPPV